MTRRVTFTQAEIQRAIRACEKAGLPVAGVEVAPGGTIRVLMRTVDETPTPPSQLEGPKPWPK